VLSVLDSNLGYGRKFERLMDGWEEKVLLMVEGLREDGEEGGQESGRRSHCWPAL
jgi:hypothetical protein